MAAPRYVEPSAGFARAFAMVARRHHTPSWRHARFDRFHSTGIPTQRVEEWKYSNASRLINQEMIPAPQSDVGSALLSDHFAGGHHARRLIFINGHFAPSLSHARGMPRDVRIRSLDDALREEPERTAALIENLDDGRSFTDLNAALTEGGAVIELEAGAALDAPLQLLFVTVGQTAAIMTHPRIILRLGEGATLDLIESHVAHGDGQTLTNLVSQYEIGARARLRHDRVQLGRPGTTLISKLSVRMGERAALDQTLATLGGSLVRNESEVWLEGSGIEAIMNGVFMPASGEHTDNVIRMHHRKPDCHSNQFYKGVLDGRGHGAFAGKIIVHKDAQRTDAFQTNNNLLLSDDAEINTKPELEIYADDVKCSHGATVGDLDPTALFYARSRGLDVDAARSMLTFAFLREVVERFSDDFVRRQVIGAILQRLPGGALSDGLN